jgi:hypothetical protein
MLMGYDEQGRCPMLIGDNVQSTRIVPKPVALTTAACSPQQALPKPASRSP